MINQVQTTQGSGHLGLGNPNYTAKFNESNQGLKVSASVIINLLKVNLELI